MILKVLRGSESRSPGSHESFHMIVIVEGAVESGRHLKFGSLTLKVTHEIA